MNISRFGRGDFFGIIIPGAFLLLNFIIIFSSITPAILLTKITDLEWILYPLIVIICYILGDILRLINPSFIDFLSSKFNILRIIVIDKIRKRKSRHFYGDKYPYITWFFDKHLEELPESSKVFWQNFLKTEYSSVQNKLYGEAFINYCKNYIASVSKDLYDDILFCEGHVRFLSGLSIALIIIIPLAIMSKSLHSYVIFLYGLCLTITLYRFRRVRAKEVATIFCTFERIKKEI